jgi:hypothetical protein
MPEDVNRRNGIGKNNLSLIESPPEMAGFFVF